MKEKQKNNKKKIVIIIIILLVLTIGGSYAYFYYSFTGSSNLISSESIELQFLESSGEIIDLNNALPMSDNEGKEQRETFDFQVKTKTGSDMNITYGLYIEKLTPSTGYTFLNDNEVKIHLTDFNNNEKVAPVKISELENYLLYSETNTHSRENSEQKDKYKLRIWIDEDVYVEDWDENTKIEYKFKIGVRTIEPPKPSAAQMLMSKVGESGLEMITHDENSTLQIGTDEDIREYRFRGGNDVVTNNYVYFNCADINNQTRSTCEIYRIIGVFPVDDGTGKIENMIKLIKLSNSVYGYDGRWNNNDTNNWSEATLNTLLNTTFYGSMNVNYQNLIGEAKYYLGGYNDLLNIKTSVMYEYERKTEGSTYYYSGNPTNWTGKIALMYASDYGYAANSTCSESTNLSDYETNLCSANNWIDSRSYEYLLTHFSLNSGYAFTINSDGYPTRVDESAASIRPVFYLTADAEFNDIGDGSIENPYQLMES